MADNVNVTPSGTTPIAADDIGGVFVQRAKLIYGVDGVSEGDVASSNPLPVSMNAIETGYFPLYSGQESAGPKVLHVDPDGSLITRGATLTDEGTFRANFANTSLAVGIGAVTVSGATVSGSGFLSTDVHIRDYFKLAADAESAWTQIESVDSDTQLTLASAYTGGTSGTGNRALLRPYTGSGGSITVGSGQLTLTGGTTASAITGIGRYTDYAPLVFRARASISQRIANQDIHIGLEEDAATTRWFARFLANGTTNTTIVCETGRNPTGAPSAAETEQTTVTLPNGATTATMQDYRIELLTEVVRFFISGVLVAEHARVIPHQHDEMTCHVEIRNGTTPASSTTVTLDFVTGKNHNKLEVGVMSNAEQIVANPAPLVPYTYSQAGVIAINTDLLIIDCSQVRGLFIQCTSMGTTGVVTPAFSNDGVNYIATTLITPAFASATTFNAAGMWYVPVMGRYLRLRLTTATTAGTTTLNVQGTQQPPQMFLGTQPVSIATNTPTLTTSSNRIGFTAASGIWYDDSATTLAANATFTGTSRDATVTATATTFANAGTYAQEVRLSAESDVTGTLWLEVSRDNTNWRRVKSVATAAVTGGGQYAEIVHRPSWRYWRVGFTNGATIQARFSIGSIAMAT